MAPGIPGNERLPMDENVHAELKVLPATERWSVIVLYEDKATRDRAMSLCDRLVKNFWSEVEFDFEWWRMDFLNDPQMGHTAAADAIDADIFIFSSSPKTDVSPIFLQWVQSWSDKRVDREGMFLDLTHAPAQSNPLVQRKQMKLREVAAKANLAYFDRVPPRLSEEFVNSWQNVETRATQVTAVLDDILNRVPPPTHFGLNE
jgi:hypothetical protein